MFFRVLTAGKIPRISPLLHASDVIFCCLDDCFLLSSSTVVRLNRSLEDNRLLSAAVRWKDAVAVAGSQRDAPMFDPGRDRFTVRAATIDDPTDAIDTLKTGRHSTLAVHRREQKQSAPVTTMQLKAKTIYERSRDSIVLRQPTASRRSTPLLSASSLQLRGLH